jgi:hypothetical protein
MLDFMSIPTWIVHLSGVAEWFLAMWLFWVLGRKLNNKWLKLMPLFMLPYMLSGWCAIAYHITYDTWEIFNQIQAILTFAGSCAFALWAFLLLRDLPKTPKLKRKVIYPADLARQVEQPEEVKRG